MNGLYIVWTYEYSVGVPIIDEQHRGIVSAINTLYYFIKKGLGHQAVKPTLLVLEHYTGTHFQTEEDIMKEAKFPGLDKHLLLHENMLKRIMEINKESILNEDPDTLLRFFKKEWRGHLINEDSKYEPYVKKLIK